MLADVELTQNGLLVTPTSSTSKNAILVKILFGEDAFNSKNQAYKILIIQRPLIDPFLSNEDYCPAEAATDSPVKEIVSYPDCLNYLKSIDSETVKRVEIKIASLVQAQESVFKTLDRAQSALESVITWAIEAFMFTCGGQIEEPAIVNSSLESLIVAPFHNVLMSLLIAKLAPEARVLTEKIEQMVKLKIDMSSLGTEVALDSFRITPEIMNLLTDLAIVKTPLEKASIFKNILNQIRSKLQNILKDSHSPFDPEPVKSLIPDDLVAATIYMLIELPSRVDMIFYNLKYIQTFGSQIPMMNEIAYSLVTIEVALGYINNFKIESFKIESTPKTISKGNNRVCNEFDEISPVDGSYQVPLAQQTFQPEICHLNANDVTCEVNLFDVPLASAFGGSPPHLTKVKESSEKRSNSFKSFRSKDSRFDRQLNQLQRMIDELAITSATSPGPSSTLAEQWTKATEASAQDQFTSASGNKYCVNKGEEAADASKVPLTRGKLTCKGSTFQQEQPKKQLWQQSPLQGSNDAINMTKMAFELPDVLRGMENESLVNSSTTESSEPNEEDLG